MNGAEMNHASRGPIASISIQLARCLLLLVGAAVANALLDSLVYWLLEANMVEPLVWLVWQAVTVVVLVFMVPPIFSQVQSTFLRRAASVSVGVVLFVFTAYLGLLLMGNARELFGLPI